jgi:Family of unknown function (DUF5678)
MNRTLEQIKPETIELLEEKAERLGLSVDDYLRSLLLTGEKDMSLKADSETSKTEESAEEREGKRQKSIAWIKSHREEYGGMYVALDGDKLIGAGKKYGDVFKLARQKGYKNAFIGDVLPLDYEGFMGGLD